MVGQPDPTNTQYLPKTDYNRDTPRDALHESTGNRTSYAGNFSTYEQEHERGDRDFKRAPRRGVTCYNCNQEGHISKNCPNKEQRSSGFHGRGKGTTGKELAVV